MSTPTDFTSTENYPLPDDWRGEMMNRIRKLIKEADPNIIEEVKWRKPSNPDGNLVWYYDGMITTGEIYKQHLRFAFAKGIELKAHDPKGLINVHRAMIIKEEDSLDEAAFKKLVKSAVALNKQAKLDKKKK
jgi:hypothetical protein